jgi:hypothetical protein
VSLPKIPTSFETVDIAGELFDLRIITRAQHFRLQKMIDAEASKDELEIFTISAATDTPLDEVREWYAVTATSVVEELVDHIVRQSRMNEGAQKRSRESDSPGDG